MELKTRVKGYNRPNHGSSCGEYVKVTQYYNPVKAEWTSIKNDVILDILCDKYRKKLRERLRRGEKLI